MLSGMLSIIAVPIGNMQDITLRALSALRDCDAIICEDTRVTGKLLQLLELPKKELISVHGQSSDARVERCMQRLREGERMALVSDAGTPCISDPGYKMVSAARREGIEVQAVPGPSAFLTALSLSGFPINAFVYMGFPPLKKGRQTLWTDLSGETKTIVLYESVHRIQKTCAEIAEAFSAEPDRRVMIGRELTKAHEECVFSTIETLKDTAQNITTKGEFVIVIAASNRKATKTWSKKHV